MIKNITTTMTNTTNMKPWKQKKIYKEKLPSSSQTRHRFKNSIKNFHVNKIVLNQGTHPIKEQIERPEKMYRAKNQFPKKKLTYLEKKEKKKKEYFDRVKKLGFEKGKKLSLGIGKYLHVCYISDIVEDYISIKYENGENIKYTLKSLMIMKVQAKYLKELEKRRKAFRLRARSIYTYNL